MCLISIIVPVYNVETYLHKCVDSLCNQSLQNIEIILVDDGSTDSSPQICDKYAEKDKRIKVIHKTNGGLSDARNAGIDIARGKYIGFLDSDDWVKSEMYEYLYELSYKNNADIAQCEFLKAYSEDISIDETIVEEKNIYDGKNAIEHLYSDNCEKSVVVWNKIYKRHLFKELRFPKGKLHEDEFTTYKLFYNANRVVYTNIPMVYYRQREGSIMNSKFNIKRLDALEALKERYIFLEENNLHNFSKMTECNICKELKNMYFMVKYSNVENKNRVLNMLKKDMIENYYKFIKNPYISVKGKITLTLCIVNSNLFSKIYKMKIK